MGITGFIVNGVLLGTGLAMDAFSVSLADGLHYPDMRFPDRLRVAGCFSFFQWIMPLIGWVFVHTLFLFFQAFQRWIPWIAFFLLLYIGVTMLREGFHELKVRSEDACAMDGSCLKTRVLLLQGIATSIDALSVGFTIASYRFPAALATTGIIAVVTLSICAVGLQIGCRAGEKLSGQATMLGGLILIGIGLKILLQGTL